MEDFASDLLAPKPAKQAPTAPVQQPRGINMGAVSDTAKMVPEYAAGGALGLVKGIADYGVGTAQAVANLPFMPEGAKSAMNSYMQMREDAYRSAVPNAQDSVEISRAFGRAIPAIGMTQSQAAPSLVGRMAQSAKVGGLSAAMTPYENDPDNFWLGKGIQTGIGTALAFAAPAVIEPMFRGLAATVNGLASKFKGAAKTMTGQTSQSSVANQLKIELQKENIDFDNLSKEVRNGLVEEARRALKAGVDLDPAAVARLAKAESQGIKLTQGQATRNPLAWSREQNLARTEAGQDIAERFTQQNRALVEGMDDRVLRTGAESVDPYDVGRANISSLRDTDKAMRFTVDGAYAVAKDHLGRAAPMDASTFSRQANLSLDDGMLGAYLPAEVRTILNDVSSGKIPFNVNTAVQIDRVMSAAQRTAGPGSPQSMAIGKVRDALNNAPIADNVGEAAKGAFDAARGLAKQRFDVLDATPAMKAAVEPGAKIAPEKFIEKYVISPSASIDDVSALMKQLGPSAKMQMQGQIMDYLRTQATSGASAETAKFSQAAFKRALNRIGDRKLELVFGKSVAKGLRSTQSVAELVQVDPIASGVNRSWTTPAAIDFFDRVGQMPVVGALMGKPGDLYRGYLSGQALNNPLGTPQQLGQAVLPEDLLRRIVPRVGMLGAPLGAAGAAGVVNQ
jgi:hypothetical protein